MLKGWKTITASIALIILGVLNMPELASLLGGCVLTEGLTVAAQPESCVLPGWVLSVIGVVMLGLRLVTTSSVFKS